MEHGSPLIAVLVIGFLPAIVSVFLMRQIGDKRARDPLTAWFVRAISWITV